jgi:hypothetical protein
VLWDDRFVTARSSVWDVLKFAFLGAYVFTMQTLVRRFFQSDLRPSADASALLRFIVVLAFTAALLQLASEPGSPEGVVAFVVGIFPVVALQALQRAAPPSSVSSLPLPPTVVPLQAPEGLMEADLGEVPPAAVVGRCAGARSASLTVAGQFVTCWVTVGG